MALNQTKKANKKSAHDLKRKRIAKVKREAYRRELKDKHKHDK